ncbi:LOW QUALITY PROTEIN: la-related protein 7-like [Rhagoletis pomonella]|uniref:LOW QUALITY PROTEIN: la-related protein 7-like n=1 Tax=Rhagoletis pomonella TaxID=28610 RepID=UPI00177FDEAE|nr:LOW QUALITY PROTEIN: la-related protein 7-like [Rhagoletis pomonella]
MESESTVEAPPERHTEKHEQKKNKKPAAAEAVGDISGGSKNYRKRKRHHFNAIRKQMEFYFGDANLSKDRFLKQLIDKDPYVPLEVFLNFNKLKALTSSVGEICKSLSNSELLELDEAQLKVKRKTALPIERNVDEKTLYVEALPAAADHDWVRQAFERFGSVVYVSLPKYAKSRKIKEFGFVEFEHESSVEKAIKAFQDFNGVLRMEETDPAELQSVKSFIKEQNEETPIAKDELDIEQKKAKKPKRGADDILDSEGPATKKTKTENDENSTATETAENTNDDTEDQQQEDGEEGSNKKKRRKKKKKAKSLEKRRKDTDLNTDASFYELKILPKRAWKRLRNKYLNLQREKVAELKRKAWKEKQQQQASEAGGLEALDATAPPPAKKPQANERNLRKMNMNFYGAGEEEAKPQPKEMKHNPALERAPLFSYAEGLIVEVAFLNPCVNIKEFKADMRQYEAVKYVDVKEGALLAHLRLDAAEAATEFVGQVSCAEYKCKVLSGEAELEYWKKIEADREMKLNKQVKVPQKRGREKVKKLITKHIRFGEDDE